MTKMSRRTFLKLGALGGAGLLFAVYFRTGGELVKGTEELWGDLPDAFEPNAWLRLDNQGAVTFRIHHSEMGQGITTGLAMILAEEMDADWSRVSVEIAPAEEVYKNPAFSVQMTGDSTSTRTSWDILRQAGATARFMLVQAAAQAWSVPMSECQTEKGLVMHPASGKMLSYGDLAPRAAQLPLPENVPLKAPADFKLIGQRMPRLDTLVKSTGEAIFGMDVQLPELLTAVVVRPPRLGAELLRWDATQTLSSPGVRHVVEIDAGIAVVADTFWQAKEAAEVLEIEWTEGNTSLSSDTFRAQWVELAQTEGRVRFEKGNFEDTLATAAHVLEGTYELPYQAHATPEPMNCTAHVANGRCVIWAPTQNQDAAQEVAAQITGLRYADIDIHTTYLGGGFGRRIAVDYVAEAVQLSQAIEKPVKVIWPRKDDLRHDFYRPGSYNVIQAGLDADGKIIAWSQKIIGPDYMVEGMPLLFPSIMPYRVPRGIRNAGISIFDAIAPTIIAGVKVVEGAEALPYAIDHFQVSHVNNDPGLPKGFWRSVAFSANTFVVESFLDEIAVETGQDPVALREQLLTDSPRLKNVLRLVAEKAQWGHPLPEGIYRGIATLDFQSAMLGMVAEVSVDKNGEVRVHRIVVALDCGIVINPQQVTAQIESGVVFGLTAAIKGQITVKNGEIEQSSFSDYPLLRMKEMPQVEVHLVASDQPPLGVGESAVPLVAPAVANAIFAATGKRVRRLPVDPAELRGIRPKNKIQ